MRISTQRLELTASDRETWAALLDGVVGPAVPGYPTLGDLVIARLAADGYLEAGEWGPWQVRESETGLLVGGVGFKGAPDADGVVEIGYGFAPEARGRGLATEAVRALVEHARRRGARAVVADTALDNPASMAVLRRAGFAETGRDAGSAWWRISLAA